MTRSAAARARLAALIVGACLICGGTFSVSPARADTAPVNPADPASPLTVSADALPTTQIDGVAWSQVVVGNTVYVAGKFTTARPAGAAPGTNTVPRNNLLAYDITTGKLVDGFAPNLNAQALAVTASPDGTRIYVAGDFTSIDGAGYYRLAAFSTATGKIIPEFRPIMGSQTRALAATNSTVYAGGTAQTVNGLPRTNLAAINATNGSTLSWTANTDAPVYALALTKDGTRLVVGGRFENLGGSPAYGLGAVDPVSGSVIPWAAAAQVRNAGTAASITSLTATDDRVYGSGYVFGAGGNLEGIFSADPGTGKIAWVEDCHGDTYSVYPLGDSVYGAGHPHYCGNIGGYPETNPRTQRYMLAFSKAATGTITRDPHGYFNWAGTPAPTLLNWFPSYVPGTFSGQGQSTWTVAGNDEYLAVGGEFPFVNGVAQSGLTRHAITALTPNAIGPSVNPELVPTAVSITAGAARISWAATFDNDNSVLTYALVRDGDLAAPVYTTTQSSNFYTRPLMGFVDKGLAPGSEHSYRLYVTDPWGNSVSRLGNTVTIVAADASDTYSAAVLADQPRSYWPLSEASGSAGLDHAGLSDLQLGTGVTRGAPGIQGSVTASRFSGNTTGFAATQTAQAAPNTFSVESWFRTSSTTGGKIVGYGNNNTKPSTKYDRHVYMDNSGRLFFGVNPGSARTISSPGAYNDGVWHQVVATLGPEGMRLFVDGKQVAARSDIIAGEAFDGYWRVGGDSLGSWASHPLSSYLNGDIAQVSVYPAVLTRQAVRDHFVASGRAATTTPTPTDAYGAAISASDPLLYWRLGDAAGARAADSGLAGNTGTYAGTVTAGATGLVNGTTDTSASFTSGAVVSGVQDYAPRAYSLETWFTTTTTAGGKLIGFGDTPSGLSKTYDRHVYMQNDGTLVFGTWTGIANTAKTTQAYNDGQRHHVVATQSADGMKLYVDGVLAGTNPQVSAQSYAGYWRIGGDPTWGSSSPYFTGVLDEAAVYPRALSAAVVKSHHDLGTYVVPPNVAPTAAFTATSTLLTTAFDASTSTDTDGTITGYAWNFGDTTTDTGPTPTHTYAAAGTYTTTLTVTDNSGATAT
ncbi:LamG-like jellyroll fold domain-containing protein, partial [Cryobacterium roopkundense]